MASSRSAQTHELSCPVCHDIFKDPVVLRCGHSFCKVCVQTWWTAQLRRDCPVCRAPSAKALTRNGVLRNLCEAFQLEQDSGAICTIHDERLKLYCCDHQTPICVVCRESNQHRNHRFTPADEAARAHRDQLREYVSTLSDKVRLFQEAKRSCEKTDEEIQNQARDTNMKIIAEFKVLEQFLIREKLFRVAMLKAEEERKRRVLQEKIAVLNGDINTLESTLNTIMDGLQENDASFLLKVKALRRAAERPLPADPQVTADPINVDKHLGNIRFNTWSKMKEKVSYTPVILNPNTAHPELYLSEDLTSVKWGPEQTVPESPERMKQHRSVLGIEGFTSGCHSWDVEVKDNGVWALGVMAPQKDGDILSGLWMVRFSHGKLTAFSPSNPQIALPPMDQLQRVRVQLDCDRGRLSFWDVYTRTVIHTFKHTFTSRLFPYINTWSDVPLKLLPVNPSIWW